MTANTSKVGCDSSGSSASLKPPSGMSERPQEIVHCPKQGVPLLPLATLTASSKNIPHNSLSSRHTSGAAGHDDRAGMPASKQSPSTNPKQDCKLTPVRSAPRGSTFDSITSGVSFPVMSLTGAPLIASNAALSHEAAAALYTCDTILQSGSFETIKTPAQRHVLRLPPLQHHHKVWIPPRLDVAGDASHVILPALPASDTEAIASRRFASPGNAETVSGFHTLFDRDVNANLLLVGQPGNIGYNHNHLDDADHDPPSPKFTKAYASVMLDVDDSAIMSGELEPWDETAFSWSVLGRGQKKGITYKFRQQKSRGGNSRSRSSSKSRKSLPKIRGKQRATKSKKSMMASGEEESAIQTPNLNMGLVSMQQSLAPFPATSRLEQSMVSAHVTLPHLVNDAANDTSGTRSTVPSKESLSAILHPYKDSAAIESMPPINNRHQPPTLVNHTASSNEDSANINPKHLKDIRQHQIGSYQCNMTVAQSNSTILSTPAQKGSSTTKNSTSSSVHSRQDDNSKAIENILLRPSEIAAFFEANKQDLSNREAFKGHIRRNKKKMQREKPTGAIKQSRNSIYDSGPPKKSIVNVGSTQPEPQLKTSAKSQSQRSNPTCGPDNRIKEQLHQQKQESFSLDPSGFDAVVGKKYTIRSSTDSTEDATTAPSNGAAIRIYAPETSSTVSEWRQQRLTATFTIQELKKAFSSALNKSVEPVIRPHRKKSGKRANTLRKLRMLAIEHRRIARVDSTEKQVPDVLAGSRLPHIDPKSTSSKESMKRSNNQLAKNDARGPGKNNQPGTQNEDASLLLADLRWKQGGAAALRQRRIHQHSTGSMQSLRDATLSDLMLDKLYVSGSLGSKSASSSTLDSATQSNRSSVATQSSGSIKSLMASSSPSYTSISELSSRSVSETTIAQSVMRRALNHRRARMAMMKADRVSSLAELEKLKSQGGLSSVSKLDAAGSRLSLASKSMDSIVVAAAANAATIAAAAMTREQGEMTSELTEKAIRATTVATATAVTATLPSLVPYLPREISMKQTNGLMADPAFLVPMTVSVMNLAPFQRVLPAIAPLDKHTSSSGTKGLVK